MKELVIDISHIDANIDIAEWKRRRGIYGVIIKCGGYENIGNGQPEQFQTRIFPRHYEATKAAGLHCGSYYYSVATDVATMRANADHCASLLKGRSFDMPIYIDIEERRQLALPKRQLTNLALAFIRRMRELGYNAGLYTSRSVINDQMYGSELEPYPLWIAEYSDRCRTDLAHGMWQFGAMNIDGDVYWGDKKGYVDANWCYVDYPSQKQGGTEKMAWATNLDDCKDAADYAYCTCAVYSCGYSQPKRQNIGLTRLRNGTAETDCSAGVNWWLFMGGLLPNVEWFHTGIMYDYLTSHGFKAYRWGSVTPKRNDVLLRSGHTALCIGDGKQAEALRTERGDAGYNGSTPGDQDGGETVVRSLGAGGWEWVFRKDTEEKPMPQQPTTNAKNDCGLRYRAHVAKAGWLASVHDGQTAGTEGYARSIEALKITPPDGMVLDAYAHVQGIGNLYYDGIRKGASSGTGSSSTDPIIGTTGQARRMEALRLVVTKWPDNLKGKRLRYQGHVQGIGWMDPVSEGQWCGTRGQKKRLEAVRIWFE